LAASPGGFDEPAAGRPGLMMSQLRRLLHRLINVIRPNREEGGLEREIAAHLLLLEEECLRQGASPEEARRTARLILGGVEHTRELHREARSFAWLDGFWRDLAYALRMIRRRPIAAAAIVLSLAIGIGLNSAVYSVIDWVLVRALPYPAPHELFRVFSAGTAPLTPPGRLTYLEFLALRGAPSLRACMAFSTATRVMSSPGVQPVHVALARVAGDLFATLGISPAIGRAFECGEMSAGAKVVVLGHDLWLRSFSGDANVAGRTVYIDGAPHTIIGVMPSGRGYPAGAELWRPLTSGEREDGDRDLDILARLAGGAPAARANAQVGALARAISHGTRTAWGEELQRASVRNVKAALQALGAATALILLIICANVTTLVSSGGANRAGEILIRGALGASRPRVMAQLLIETLVLALSGGALGLLLGRLALRILVVIAPAGIPRLGEITLDTRIAAIGVAATVLIGLMVGLAPAWRLSSLAGRSGLNRAASNRVTRGSGGRRVLVLVQVVAAVVLTAGASLLARSLQYLVAIDNGFAADRLIAADLYLRGVFDGDSRRLFQTLMAEAANFPGVASTAVSLTLPTQVIGLRASVNRAGEAGASQPVTWRPVSARYFDTVGIPIIAGRPFDGTDRAQAPRVAIVNRAFLQGMPLERAPLGSRLIASFSKDPVTVVGVVGDVTPEGEADRPAVYVSIDQFPIGGGKLLIRTRGDPRAAILPLAARLRGVAPGLAMDRVFRVAETLEANRAVTRFTTVLAGTFAGLALFISLIGVYGLVTGEVSARWRELAVRLALGASHTGALWTVIWPCAAVLCGGAAIGVAGALAAGSALRSLLHGVAAEDAYTLAFAPALLGIAGMAAAALAGVRVLRADPAATLRSE
jgi:predicted permease